MYFHSISPFFVKVMSSSGNVWAVNCIQHICNNANHKSPIYGLFRLSKHSQRDNFLQFKASYGVSEKCVAPRNFSSGVFF